MSQYERQEETRGEPYKLTPAWCRALNAQHFQRCVAFVSFRFNSLSVTEQLSSGAEALHSNGSSSCALCLDRLPSAGTGRASDIGEGRTSSISRSSFLLFRNSPSATLTHQPPSLYSSFFSSLVSPSISGWHHPHALREVAHGGREGSSAVHLTVRSLPYWHDPPVRAARSCTHTNVHAQGRTHSYKAAFI